MNIYPLEIGKDVEGVVNGSSPCYWRFDVTNEEETTVNLVASLKTAKIVGNVIILLSDSAILRNYPKKGDHKFVLDSKARKIQTQVQLSKGSWYLKIVTVYSPKIEYQLNVYYPENVQQEEEQEQQENVQEQQEEQTLVSSNDGKNVSNIDSIENVQTRLSLLPSKPSASKPVTVPSTPPVQQKRKKVALIIGINSYKYIDGLSFCNNDSISWYDYLLGKGYQKIILLGDGVSTYGKYKPNGLATEAGIRSAIRELGATLNAGDLFSFITSGHGSGDGKGNSYLCCLDCRDGVENGQYTDIEVSNDFGVIVKKGVNLIAFFDNCFSGGLIPELTSLNPALVCVTSTCSDKGYGYDEASSKHGSWTNCILINVLMKNPKIENLGVAFGKASKSYTHKGNDFPAISGNVTLMF